MVARALYQIVVTICILRAYIMVYKVIGLYLLSRSSRTRHANSSIECKQILLLWVVV